MKGVGWVVLDAGFMDQLGQFWQEGTTDVTMGTQGSLSASLVAGPTNTRPIRAPEPRARVPTRL